MVVAFKPRLHPPLRRYGAREPLSRGVAKEGRVQPELDAISVIVAAFAPIVGKRILDVGCGTGALLRLLSVRGARVVGVEPNDKVLALARRAAPEGAFHPAGAEALPFVDRSFDGAVFLNSLHHVPGADIRPALREASCVVKPGSPIVVIEPLAEGRSSPRRARSRTRRTSASNTFAASVSRTWSGFWSVSSP